MSMLIFSHVVDRAKFLIQNRKALVTATPMSVSAELMVFVGEHVHLLEEQLGASQNLVEDWKLEAKRTQRQLDAILDSVSPTAKQALLDIIAQTK